MDNSDLLKKIIKELNFIDNLYDFIRLVDPIEKKAYAYLKSSKLELQDPDQTCYSFWEKNAACENCISMRAYNQKSTIVKIEDKNGKLFLITSVPADIGSRTVVIELIRDITYDGVVDIAGMEEFEVHKLISNRNSHIIKDALTKIYNEQFIYERLPYTITNSNKNNLSLALFRVKIRNMDVINSTYGYPAGDYVIKEIANTIHNFPRNSEDWASRYGGTEIILVIQSINEIQANRLRKRIFDKVSQLNLEFEEKKIIVDIKIGFHITMNEAMTPEQLIEKAGKSMYSVDELTDKVDLKTGKEELFGKLTFTPREKEVALLLLEGKSNIQIGKKLYIGLSTVKKHISSIFYKANVSSMSEFFAKVSEY